MVDTPITIDIDNHDQIRLLSNLRQDMKNILQAHPKGIWFQMLPKVFYMHFQRDIHLDRFGITHPLFFLDCISDMIEFDLPENLNDEDFIITLNSNPKQTSEMSMRAMDLTLRREILFRTLEKATQETRGALLRDICIADELLKRHIDEQESSTMLKVRAREQVAVRLQKIRSMIDICLRSLLQRPEEISDLELIELFHHADQCICHLTPVAQRLSLLPH